MENFVVVLIPVIIILLIILVTNIQYPENTHVMSEDDNIRMAKATITCYFMFKDSEIKYSTLLTFDELDKIYKEHEENGSFIRNYSLISISEKRILNMLKNARSKKELLRASVASNELINEEMFDILRNDESDLVRMNLYINESLSLDQILTIDISDINIKEHPIIDIRIDKTKNKKNKSICVDPIKYKYSK